MTVRPGSCLRNTARVEQYPTVPRGAAAATATVGDVQFPLQFPFSLFRFYFRKRPFAKCITMLDCFAYVLLFSCTTCMINRSFSELLFLIFFKEKLKLIFQICRVSNRLTRQTTNRPVFYSNQYGRPLKHSSPGQSSSRSGSCSCGVRFRTHAAADAGWMDTWTMDNG